MRPCWLFSSGNFSTKSVYRHLTWMRSAIVQVLVHIPVCGIGISTAKGLCFAADKPLIAIPTLDALAFAATSVVQAGDRIIPMLDAQHMEVYTQVYDFSGHPESAPEALVLDEQAFAALLAQGPVWFLGDALTKARPLLSAHPNARFLPDVLCSAQHHAQPALRCLGSRTIRAPRTFGAVLSQRVRSRKRLRTPRQPPGLIGPLFVRFQQFEKVPGTRFPVQLAEEFIDRLPAQAEAIGDLFRGLFLPAAVRPCGIHGGS